MLRIKKATPLSGHRLRLELTDSSVVERDVGRHMAGPVFEPILSNSALFRQVRVEHGTVVWPGDVDLCPDVVIWDGSPPKNGSDADFVVSRSSELQDDAMPR